MPEALNAEYLNLVIDATCDQEGDPIRVVARCMRCWEDFHIDAVHVQLPCPVHGEHSDGYAEPISFLLLQDWALTHVGPIIPLRYYPR